MFNIFEHRSLGLQGRLVIHIEVDVFFFKKLFVSTDIILYYTMMKFSL